MEMYLLFFCKGKVNHYEQYMIQVGNSFAHNMLTHDKLTYILKMEAETCREKQGEIAPGARATLLLFHFESPLTPMNYYNELWQTGPRLQIRN
jgi:hypothetical protein